MRKIEELIFHWSVTSPESEVSDLRNIHLSHGWRDIGYHRVILHPNSRQFKGKIPTRWWELVKEGRRLDNDPYLEQDEVGAHTLYHNHYSVGICVIGRPGEPLHPLQALAIVMTAITLCRRFNLSLSVEISFRRMNKF